MRIARLITVLLVPAAVAAAPARVPAPRPSGSAAAPPVALGPAESDSLVRALLESRAETEAWLRAGKTSYLATVERVDFGPAMTLTVGRAPGNDVRLEADSIADHHLRVTVVGDQFHVEALDAPATFRLGAAEARDTLLGPSSIGLGRFTIRLSHQRFPALIVFDPQSPRFKDYKGLRFFAPDLHYRYALGLRPNPRPDTVIILSTRGNRRRALRVGWFDFRVGKTPCRLEATRLLEPGVGENDVSVFFRDATTGKECYPVGRYVDPVRLTGGRYLLDFNLAYNPACAFSDHYNCPIPPRENRLKVAIRAGEMDSHYH